jgi:hypothetical protein
VERDPPHGEIQGEGGKSRKKKKSEQNPPKKASGLKKAGALDRPPSHKVCASVEGVAAPHVVQLEAGLFLMPSCSELVLLHLAGVFLIASGGA